MRLGAAKKRKEQKQAYAEMQTLQRGRDTPLLATTGFNEQLLPVIIPSFNIRILSLKM